MDIQRLRNLTTKMLHTKFRDIYADIEAVTGVDGMFTHMLPNACRALEPYLREVAPDARLWDGSYDLSHTGEVAVPQMDAAQQAEFWKRYDALPSPFARRRPSLSAA